MRVYLFVFLFCFFPRGDTILLFHLQKIKEEKMGFNFNPLVLECCERAKHIVMVIGKCTGVFRRIFWLGGGGEKREICWGNLPSRIFHGGRKFP